MCVTCAQGHLFELFFALMVLSGYPLSANLALPVHVNEFLILILESFIQIHLVIVIWAVLANDEIGNGKSSRGHRLSLQLLAWLNGNFIDLGLVKVD